MIPIAGISLQSRTSTLSDRRWQRASAEADDVIKPTTHFAPSYLKKVPDCASLKSRAEDLKRLPNHCIRLAWRMAKPKRRTARRVELGRYIVADPAICHGKPTFKGTRVFVSDVLADVERGLSWDFILHRWGGGKICKAAVTEAVHLAREALLDEDGNLGSLSKA